MLGSTAIAAARPAGAIVILDSTWRADGGRPDRESAGFGTHIALANRPQFASLVAFFNDAGGRARILTAAHVFERGETASEYVYRTPSGKVQRGVGLVFHPKYNWNINDREGFDFAIVTLADPLTDAGPQPALYAGVVREETRVVMVGFGSRGIASIGERPEYHAGSYKAAAENTVDEVMEPVTPMPSSGNVGNWFSVTMRRESEGATRLEGILGKGDSGGSAGVQSGPEWAIAGVNSNGTANDTYGSSSFFARVSGVQDWLRANLPGLRFIA